APTKHGARKKDASRLDAEIAEMVAPIRWKLTRWPLSDWGRVVARSTDNRYEILFYRKSHRYYAHDRRTNIGDFAPSLKAAKTKASQLKAGWDPLSRGTR